MAKRKYKFNDPTRNPFDLPDESGRWGEIPQAAIEDVRGYYTNFDPVQHRLLTRLPGWGDAMQQASRRQMVRIPPAQNGNVPYVAPGSNGSAPPVAGGIGVRTVSDELVRPGTFTGRVPRGTSPNGVAIAANRAERAKTKAQELEAFNLKNFGVKTQQDARALNLPYGKTRSGGKVQQLTRQEKSDATAAPLAQNPNQPQPVDVSIAQLAAGQRPSVPDGTLFHTPDGGVYTRSVNGGRDLPMAWSDQDQAWVSRDEYLETLAQLNPSLRPVIAKARRAQTKIGEEMNRGPEAVMRPAELQKMETESEKRLNDIVARNPITTREMQRRALDRQNQMALEQAQRDPANVMKQQELQAKQAEQQTGQQAKATEAKQNQRVQLRAKLYKDLTGEDGKTPTSEQLDEAERVIMGDQGKQQADPVANEVERTKVRAIYGGGLSSDKSQRDQQLRDLGALYRQTGGENSPQAFREWLTRMLSP